MRVAELGRWRREGEENDKLRGKDKNTDIATTQGDLHMIQDEEAKCRLERLIEEHWLQIKRKNKGRNKLNRKRKKKGR